MYKILNGIKIEMTQEEIDKLEQERLKFEAYESHRKLTQFEVFLLLAKQQVNSFAIDDKTSLKMKEYYPKFKEVCDSKKTVKQGYKFTYENDLYKTKQAEMVLQAHFPPSIHTASLYEIINEEHIGNKYDPVPFPQDGNMTLEKDKYYSEDGKLYLCTVASGNPPYNKLKNLVGIFVTLIENV